MKLKGKKIILGVSGSIAAYKAVFLLRLLQKEGAEVRVVSTPAVEKFVSSLTFSSLIQRPVFSDLWAEGWSEHVALGTWADLLLVVPVTAHTLAKMAQGLCDNALMAVYLAAPCPVIVAPAMDADMYVHPRTQSNLSTLQQDGVKVLPVGQGFLASGLEGPGRLLEPEQIMEEVLAFFGEKPLSGTGLLITAGPTREAIDPVRYISNRSTGKMGYALAAKARELGADVTLISGPTALADPPGVHTLRVVSAKEMYEAVHERAEQQDILIMAAAVSDYSPLQVADKKIKKDSDSLNIPLAKTEDILKSLGKKKRQNQLLIGFALETHDEIEHAKRKLESKNLDFIVLNSLQDKGAGFAHDTNKITILFRDNQLLSFPLKEKAQVAGDILNQVVGLWKQKKHSSDA